MNILLIGSGGREHAIAWKLAQSPLLRALYAAPGNPGIAKHAQIVALDASNHAEIVSFCRENDVGLVVIGPEGPLVDGLADSLRAATVPVFGPDKAAAALEGSKGFTKDLCARIGIPTAAFARYRDPASARAGVGAFGYPAVIKADGLAAGKGVVIAENEAEALAAIDALSGQEIVIEEFLTGEEVSLFALSDGVTVRAFASAQDHKRAGQGDTGPNTGGMGAYSPASILTAKLERKAMERIVLPTVAAMDAAGTPFIGVLFAGLMLTADGPKLIEYNARFGDPETQVILPRFEGDLAALMFAVATGKLPEFETFRFSADAALTVVMAATGYPRAPQLGGGITGIEAAEATGALVFQAGVAQDNGQLVAAGGRVLSVTATGSDIREAQTKAYLAIGEIGLAGFSRPDIGWREVARENASDMNAAK